MTGFVDDNKICCTMASMKPSPSPEITTQWLESALAIAKQAGLRILDFYPIADGQIALKADQSPVTQADLAAHDLIVRELAQLTPEVPVLSEEGAEVAFAQRSQWGCYWLVDPLDGTRHFIQGDAGFSVNIALIVNHQPRLGVVYAPVTQICYFAQQGAFAYKQQCEGKPQPIRVHAARRRLVVASSARQSQRPALRQFLARLGEYELLTLGSSLKSCAIAEGVADVYPCFGQTAEWDTAAAQCILEAAGGQLTDTQMQPLRYNTKASLLNPPFLAFGDNRRYWADYLA